MDSAPDTPWHTVVRRDLVWLIRTQRRWLWIAIPLAISLYYPIRWSQTQWLSWESGQAWQWFVLPGAIVLAFSRREQIGRTYDQLKVLFPEENSPKRRGNPILIVLGGLSILMAHLVMAPQLAFLGAIFVIAGVIFDLYGPFLLKEMLWPLLFLLLGIPIPNEMSGILSGFLQVGTANSVAKILGVLKQGQLLQGITITMSANSYVVVISPLLNGMFAMTAAASAAFWWSLLRKIEIGRALVLIVTALFIGAIFSQIRPVLMGLISSNTSAADFLGRIPPVVEAVATIGALAPIARWLAKRRRRKDLV